MSRRPILAAFALVAAIVMVAPVAHADGARPPIGNWVGTFADGSQIQLFLQANGDCMYGPIGGTPIVGKASWNPSYSGGILTLTYYNAQFLSHAYYSITWINETSFVLSDPYFRVTMQPRR